MCFSVPLPAAAERLTNKLSPEADAPQTGYKRLDPAYIPCQPRQSIWSYFEGALL